MARTLQDVLALCREKDVKIVDFKMTDIDGRWRHLSIPVDRLNRGYHVYGIGFDRAPTMATRQWRTAIWCSSPIWILLPWIPLRRSPL